MKNSRMETPNAIKATKSGNQKCCGMESSEYGDYTTVMGSQWIHLQNSSELNFSPAHTMVRTWLKLSGEEFPEIRSEGRFKIKLNPYLDGRDRSEETVLYYRASDASNGNESMKYLDNKLFIVKTHTGINHPSYARIIETLYPGEKYTDHRSAYNIGFSHLEGRSAIVTLNVYKKKRLRASLSVKPKKVMVRDRSGWQFTGTVENATKKTDVECRSKSAFVDYPWLPGQTTLKGTTLMFICKIHFAGPGDYTADFRAIEGHQATEPVTINFKSKIDWPKSR